MRRLFVVANAIGRDATLTDLIPFLQTHVRSSAQACIDESGAAAVPTGLAEEDEILLILSEQLGELVLCGLVPGYRALPILDILEQLCGVEETVVRDKAAESVRAIIPHLVVDRMAVKKGKEEEEARLACVRNAPAALVGLVKRLANAEWFTAKISACAILPNVYQFLNIIKAQNFVSGGGGANADTADGVTGGHSIPVHDTKADLRALYKSLCEEDAPMVRRGAAKNLGRYVEAVAGLPYGKAGATGNPLAKELVLPGGKDETLIQKKVNMAIKTIVLDEIVPLYQALANDEQDSVRLLAVSSSGSVGIALGMDGDLCARAVLPIIIAGTSDVSWRVRHNLAKEFAIIAQSQGFHESSHKPNLTQVFTSFASLLQDFEAEVRASAVDNIAPLAQLGGVDLFQSHLSPLLPLLAEDPVMEVRRQLAQTLMDCCDDSICTSLTDTIVLEELKPLWESFLNDEFPDVQLHILSKLSRVTHLLDKMDAIVHCLLDMTQATNWRVREAVARLVPHIVEARGVEFFEAQLLQPWLALVLDQVADVRSACVSGMGKLLTVTGSTWVQTEMLPTFVSTYDDSTSYLRRITILRSCAQLSLAEKGLTSALCEAIVNQLLRGLEDKVANVRMVAAKGLRDIAPSVEKGLMKGKIRPALENVVQQDEDDDAKYFAEQALEACSSKK